eukprot:CAMPEP_0117572832 /NCGR_PEP_ID=MMETSP0784-20121206/60575_1 /TAXON_ID=39447 /ORGANISM="" /LENGTH=213 /DNA_ID=CAMNT_0005371245 /DNA_START=23 /DNA_END=661 /DNA_ORIENTATION=-
MAQRPMAPPKGQSPSLVVSRETARTGCMGSNHRGGADHVEKLELVAQLRSEEHVLPCAYVVGSNAKVAELALFPIASMGDRLRHLDEGGVRLERVGLLTLVQPRLRVLVQNLEAGSHERPRKRVVDKLQRLMGLGPYAREQYVAIERPDAAASKLDGLVAQKRTDLAPCSLARLRRVASTVLRDCRQQQRRMELFHWHHASIEQWVSVDEPAL